MGKIIKEKKVKTNSPTSKKPKQAKQKEGGVVKSSLPEAKQPASKKKRDRLTLHQEAFVSAITNIDNKKTFLNATQSKLAIRPHMNYDTAKSVGSETLALPHVRREVRHILQEMNLSREVRINTLDDIVHNATRMKTRHRKLNEEGKMVEVYQIEQEVSPVARIKAIDLLNKMEGLYEENSATVDIAKDEYKRMRADLEKELNMTRDKDKRG